MAVSLHLRYDLRAPDWGVPQADLIEACIDQAAWADDLGFERITFSEHHGSEDGYLPSPMAMAAAVAARTRRIKINVAALILPLHDPVRIAEDAAVVDQISRGRLEMVIGAGYVSREFAMMGKTLDDRVQAQTEGVEVLRRAWAGETVSFRGAQFTVTPRPYTEAGPRLWLGGSTPGAARRAARIADGFEPTVPGLDEAYRQECARLGKEPSPARPPSIPAIAVHVAEDPDAAWEQIAPYALHETNSYAVWLAESGLPAPYSAVPDADTLKAFGMYQVLTPDELVAKLVELGPESALGLHPLFGGLDPKLSWSSLRLIESAVLPELRRRGLLA